MVDATAAEKAEKYLRIWTVYKHPTDYPDCYVARLFENDVPTASFVASPNYSTIEQMMWGLGLAKFSRDPSDDPKILEIWV